MATEKVNYNDVFSADFNTGIEKTLSLLTELEKTVKDISKTKIKTDGGAAAIKENEKAIQESLKTQKLLIDIEKKKEVISKQNTLTLKELNDLMNKQTRTINELKDKNNQLAQARNNVDKSSVKGKKIYDELTKSIAKNTAELKKLDKEVGNFQRNVGNYPDPTKMFGGLLAAGGIGVGLSGAFSELKDIGEMIKNFDARIAELGAISGSSKEELEPLKQTILDLGASTKFTATQVAEASIELAKLGFSNNEIQQSLKGVLDGAVAMSVGIPQMAELASKSIRAFGLTTKDTEAVVSTFAASANTTATSFQYLNDSLPYAATAAKTYGMSIEQTTALLGILADNGVKAESSGVALRDIFTDLSTKGLTFEQAMAQINSSTNKAKTAFDLFGKTSVNQSIIIANNIDKFEGLTKAITNQESALKELVEKRLDTLEGSLQILSSAWEGFILNIEDGKGAIVGATRGIIDFTSEILTSLTNGNAFTSTLQSMFDRFSDVFNVIGEIVKRFAPLNKEVSTTEILFNALALAWDIAWLPLKAILWGLEQLGHAFIWVYDNFKPLRFAVETATEIFGYLAEQLGIVNTEIGKLADEGLTKLGKSYRQVKTDTDNTTKSTKEYKEQLKELEKQASETSKTLGGALSDAIILKGREKDIIEPIDNALLEVVKVTRSKSVDFKNALFSSFEQAGTAPDLFDYNELFDALQNIEQKGLEVFNQINSENQKRTENAITESEKRIEQLQKEYDAEKTLQEQRKEEGKAYDEKRLQQLNTAIASENIAKERQQEQLRKYQKRALLTQIIADEASSLSSAIVAAFGNPANKFTFGAAGIAQLAAMTIQLTSAFLKVRAAVDKFEEGGMIGGRSHKDGGTLIEAERGEFITRKTATAKSRMLLNAINEGKITDRNLNLLINPIPSINTNLVDFKGVETLLSENINVNRSGFGTLSKIPYIENGYKVERKNGLLVRYK